MDSKLASLGYEFGPSKYSPALGHSDLKVLISGQPTQRFFDVKTLHIPTFDGHYYHQTQITRHELMPSETFAVCLGELRLDAYRGEHLRVFSFGGNLRATVESGDLYCAFTSQAPIFKLQDDPITVSGVIADEIMDLLAEKQATMTGHEDAMYSRLAKVEPYPLFLACLVSMQKLVDSIPTNRRQEKYRMLASNLKRAFQIVRETDGWDGRSPSLEDLLFSGGA